VNNPRNEYERVCRERAVLRDRIAELEAERDRLRGQLPEEMQHCTIRYLQCDKGHGRLTAANWIDHGCYVCKLESRAPAMTEAERRTCEAVASLVHRYDRTACCSEESVLACIDAGRDMIAERHPAPPKRTLEDVLDDLASDPREADDCPDCSTEEER